MEFADALRNVGNVLEQTFSPETYLAKQKLAQQAQDNQARQAQNLLLLNNQINGPAAQLQKEKLGAMQDQAQQVEGLKTQLAPIIQAMPDSPQKQGMQAVLTSGNPDQIAKLSDYLAIPPNTAQDKGQIQQGTDAQGNPKFFRVYSDNKVVPIEGLTPKVPATEKVNLVPEAVDRWARVLHETGTIASLGRASKADREAIFNRESQLFPSSAGDNIVVNQMAYKANSAGLTAITKDLTAIKPYKDMLDKNADIAINLAKKVLKTNSSLANKTLNWAGQHLTDYPDLAEYMAQMRILTTESARVLNNPRLVGQLTDSARQEMEQIVSGDMPIHSTIRVIQRIKQDGENRIGAMQNAQQDLLSKYGNKNNTSSNDPLGLR